MNCAQPNLFGDDQPDLFGPATAPKPDAYRVKPQHVLNRFTEFDTLLAKATVWPWDAFHRIEMRERTWPYLLAKLREIGCAPEAAHWEAAMAAHVARLDAATPPDPAD
jgi:hypothetical protein